MKIFITILALFSFSTIFTGCGVNQTPDPVLQVGTFNSYVSKFEDYSQQYGKPIKINNLIIKMGTLPSTILGQCTTSPTMNPTVVINQDLWGNLSSADQEVLVLHEMGHCVLYRVHQNLPDTPARLWKSIMLAWTQQVTDYDTNQPGYLSEFFNQEQDDSQTPTPLSAVGQGLIDLSPHAITQGIAQAFTCTTGVDPQSTTVE